MMKPYRYTGPLVIAAVVGISGSAYAQQGCQGDIDQLRTQNQQRQVDQSERQQVSRLLDQAERAGAQDCDQYVQQARQQIDRRQGEQPQQIQQRQGQPAQAQQETSQQPMNVQIEQQPAEVEVSAAAPEVIVHQQPPIVTVEQQPPRVEIRQPEAEVNVTQAEPRVTVNQAEPNVQVQQAEPQVNVTQAGEPEVFMLGPDSEQGVAQRQQVQGQQASQSQQSTAGISESEASRLVGSSAISNNGEEVGSVSAVVQDQAGDQLYAIVDVGGFLGMGERSVAIPIARAQINQEGQLEVNMSRDQLEDMPEYDSEEYRQYGLIQ